MYLAVVEKGHTVNTQPQDPQEQQRVRHQSAQFDLAATLYGIAVTTICLLVYWIITFNLGAVMMPAGELPHPVVALTVFVMLFGVPPSLIYLFFKPLKEQIKTKADAREHDWHLQISAISCGVCTVLFIGMVIYAVI